MLFTWWNSLQKVRKHYEVSRHRFIGACSLSHMMLPFFIIIIISSSRHINDFSLFFPFKGQLSNHSFIVFFPWNWHDGIFSLHLMMERSEIMCESIKYRDESFTSGIEMRRNFSHKADSLSAAHVRSKEKKFYECLKVILLRDWWFAEIQIDLPKCCCVGSRKKKSSRKSF